MPSGLGAVVGQAEMLGGRGDERLEDVDLEVRRDLLHHGGQPFEAHAGVDVLGGQGFELAGADPVELGEDEVPDLDFLDPVAVVEDLRAGAADAVGAVGRGSGGPEVVVLAHPGDPVGGEADLLVPDAERLVVVEVDGDGQAVGGDLRGSG